jgi:hypothetical protein
MTVDIYPAYIRGKKIIHSDNWDEQSTLNIANANFYALIKTLGLDSVVTESPPGHIKIRTLESALKISPETRYTERLRKICAVARITRANCIAFA